MQIVLYSRIIKLGDISNFRYNNNNGSWRERETMQLNVPKKNNTIGNCVVGGGGVGFGRPKRAVAGERD